MPIARSLWELQESDNALLALQREKSKLDDGSELRARRDTLQKAIAVEEENLNRCNRVRADAEAELKTREQKLQTQQTRLMNAKSAHEVSSLQRDIDSITKSRGEFDETILSAMDEAETLAGKLDELRAQLDAVSTQLQAVEAHFAAETTRLDEALKAAAERRDATADVLDEDALEKYNAVASKHADTAVAQVSGGSCSVCGNAITPHNLKTAKSEEWPTCESCGRLLFVETL
jgi:predicted  nucleic acid-binding Zn-ribbon protein